MMKISNLAIISVRMLMICSRSYSFSLRQFTRPPQLLIRHSTRLRASTADPVSSAPNSNTDLFDEIDKSNLVIAVKIASIKTRDNEDMTPFEKLNEISAGIKSWKKSLLVGNIPEDTIWPVEPLFTEISIAFEDLKLPRLTYRHPELIPATIRGLLELILKYLSDVDCKSAGGVASAEVCEAAAASAVEAFVSKWEKPLKGLEQLDECFGPNHGILPTFDEEEPSGGGQGSGAGDKNEGSGGGKGGSNNKSGPEQVSSRGVGLHDGLWQHSGWHQMDKLQEKLRTMHELQALIKSLGKRASVTGNTMRKYPPQVANPQAPQSVISTPYSPMEVKSVRRSDTLEGLLPSELLLMTYGRKRNNVVDDEEYIEEQSNLASKIHHLVLARRIERSLASYELSGWEDQKAKPTKASWRYMKRLPTAFGGPIIICLDTSGSMCGEPEVLAKAVALECAIAAAKQHRNCFVLSFSGRGLVKSCDLTLSSGVAQLNTLLDFLSYSFNGGTDIESPLLEAMRLIETTKQWESADILLVTDGMLMDPPMSQENMDKLRMMEKDRGLEVHGLLIGSDDSSTLSSLCTKWDGMERMHNFLNRPSQGPKKASPFSTSSSYSSFTAGSRSRYVSRMSYSSSPAVSSHGMMMMANTKSYSSLCLTRNSHHRVTNNGRFPTALYASTDRNSHSIVGQSDSKTYKENYFNAKNELDIPLVLKSAATKTTFRINDAFNAYLQENVDEVKATYFRSRIIPSIGRMENGLIERGKEVRLILLAALCREHILLLGPPGTGKSELGRRLAALSSGHFFERLLTKYTTPEELFGPLSLSALERDEYVRNIKGYLPSSSVAFLDEIFKANSAILNSLLTILNERLFDNGNARIKVPLLAVVGASNELPESEELDALYDRFLLRKLVKPVSDESVRDLLKMGFTPVTLTYDQGSTSTTDDEVIGANGEKVQYIDDEFVESIITAASTVTVPLVAISLLEDIRIYLRDKLTPSIYISDRRLLKALNLLRISAASHGRKYVTVMDCLLLKNTFWHIPEDFSKIEEWLLNRITTGSQLEGLKFLVDNTYQNVKSRLETERGSGRKDRDPDASDQELVDLANVLLGRITEAKAAAAEFQGKLSTNGVDSTHLWLDSDECSSVSQRLAAPSTLVAKKLKTMLNSVLALDIVLKLDNIEADDRVEELTKVWEACENAETAKKAGKDKDIESSLSEKEQAYTRKEAQKYLTSDQMKEWKKVQKMKKDLLDSED